MYATLAHRRKVRSAGLMTAASVLSLMMAGEAQAACTANPAQPLNAITTDSTVVLCTGFVNGPVITVNANGTLVDVNGSGTNVPGATINVNGNSNAVTIRNSATLNGSQINTVGDGNTVLWGFGSITNGSIITVSGANSQLLFDSGSQVTQNPGQTTISSAAGQSNNVQISAGGGLYASFGNGQYLLTGGTGNQNVTILGFLIGPSDGLAIGLGDGEDTISIGASANVSNQGGGAVLFNGGAGSDTFNLYYNGTWDHNTAGFETLTIAPNTAVTLTGTNADASTIDVQGGSVTVTSGAPLGTATSTIQIGQFADLTLDFTSSASFDHVLAGSGALTIDAPGSTLTFGGASSSYTGPVTIGASSTAVLGVADALGTGAISNNGVLQFDGLHVANTISGTGQVIVTGSGNARLSGANSFSGGLDVRGGVLDVASTQSLGSGIVTSSTAGAILAVGNTTNEILANNLTGNLALVKAGAGVLDLTGSNSYTTGTLINGGAIRVDGFARLGSGPVIANAGGSLILNYNGAGQLLQSSPFMTGAGSFIKEGTGDVVMSLSSTYTGGTTIRAGRIGLNNGDALGTGNIQIDGGATLGIGGITLANIVTGNGSIVKTANNQATLSGDNSGFSGLFDIQAGGVELLDGRSAGSGSLAISSGSYVFVNSAVGDTMIAADISGAGDLENVSNTRLTLTGNNMLSGVVFVSNGTLQIEGSQNIGTANINIVGSTARLNLDTAGNTTLANIVAGNGGLVKTGTGTVFMTGPNTYSGGTDIQQGALRVTNVNVLGTGPIIVQQGAALDFAISGQQSLNQTISGAGILRKSDAGDLTLLGNSLSGGLDITGGRVLVNGVAALGTGPVTTAADTQLVFTNSGTEVLSTPISGAGTLTMNGSGSLIVQNANSYTGGTLINTGRIGLNDGQGLGSGSVLVLQNAELGIGNITFANAVSGAGRIVKTASGTANLTGTNTHSGGIDIQGGTLAVNGSAPLGTGGISIASGAQLNYTNAAAATFGNALSGAGTFNKLGAGQLNFTNNFGIGTLNLTAGRIRLNAIGTANVNVASGTTLDGTGRVVGTLTNNGTVAPGNSIGTLTVQGNYVQNAGSVLEVEFDGSGNIDLLSVTGSATLNGGTLRFISLGGAEGSGGTFLTAAGGVTGTFATVETVGATLPLSVIYQPNSAIMAPSVLTARPSTFNAQAHAAADTAMNFIGSLPGNDGTLTQGRRIWMSGFGAWDDRSASGTTLGYGHNSHGVSGGITLPIGTGFTVGAALGWADGTIRLGSNGGGGEQSTLLGNVSLRFIDRDGHSIAAGIIGGKVDQDTLRNVSFNGFSASVAGTTESSILGGYASAYVPLTRSNTFVLAANVRGSVIRQSQDAYVESGTSPLRLSVPEINTTTAEAEARLSGAYTLSGNHEHGASTLLRFDLGGRYLAALGDREIPVTFATSSASVTLLGDQRDSLQAVAGLGVSYATRSGILFDVGYRAELGRRDSHSVRGTISIGF